jgi:hypothetical protein
MKLKCNQHWIYRITFRLDPKCKICRITFRLDHKCKISSKLFPWFEKWNSRKARQTRFLFYLLFPSAQQPQVGQGLRIIEASLSHPDTPHSVELLRTGDQPDAETCQSTTLTRGRHPCPRQDSNPQPPVSERLQTYALRQRGRWDMRFLFQ